MVIAWEKGSPERSLAFSVPMLAPSSTPFKNQGFKIQQTRLRVTVQSLPGSLRESPVLGFSGTRCMQSDYNTRSNGENLGFYTNTKSAAWTDRADDDRT